jgi:hypothetical protein
MFLPTSSYSGYDKISILDKEMCYLNRKIIDPRADKPPLIADYSTIYESIEVAIQKMIEASQRMITINRQREGKIRINAAVKRHFELQIKILQNAPRRDVDKL